MSSACRSALLVCALLCGASAAVPAREFRVCADPDNLPLSRDDGSGFENRIARLVAAEMGAQLRYEWLPLRRGFVRKTMGAGSCDAYIGVPKDLDSVLTTRAYYRSSYVFVNGPRARGVDTFDDERLSRLRIGVQLVGQDLAATPAGYALTATGHVDNVRGFPVYGDGPAAQREIGAIGNGVLDTALVWGPQAGYFAALATPPLELRIAHAHRLPAPVPFEFDIAMGVRRGDVALRDELDAILDRRRNDIDAILAAYSVPRTDLPRHASP
jgi:quinoprotein dehydrogenase-associated probable ABC transporter substrate-binding protein